MSIMVQLSLLFSLLLFPAAVTATAAAGSEQDGQNPIRKLRRRQQISQQGNGGERRPSEETLLLQDQPQTLVKQEKKTVSHLRRKKEQKEKEKYQEEHLVYGRRDNARPSEHRKLQLAPDDSVILDDYIVEVDPLKVSDLTALVDQWTKKFNVLNERVSVGTGRAIIKQRYQNALYGIRIVLYDDNNNNDTNNINAEGSAAQMWKYSDSVLMNLLSDDQVLSVEENQIATVLETATTSQTAASVLQTQSTDQGRWGLNYLDYPTTDQQYSWTLDGSGVHVYIIDSGMELDHDEFDNGARATCAYEVIKNNKGPCYDGHSHGTHVAGIVGGKTVGVAKGVMLHSVKVLDNSGMGSMADVADGIDWVVAQKQGALSNQKMIMNLSVGGSKSSVLNKAVRNAVKSGLLVVGAAANSGRDACNSSPGAVTNALIVGAMDESETIASFSNYGSCVDLWAPGVDIESAANLGPSSYMSKSGTSQASPFVAGLAALYMQKSGGSAETVVTALLADARVVPSLSANGSPDLVAYSGVVNGEQPPVNAQNAQNSNTNSGNQNSSSGNNSNSKKNTNSNAASASEVSTTSSSSGQNESGKLTMMKLIYGVGGTHLDDQDRHDKLEKPSAVLDGNP